MCNMTFEDSEHLLTNTLFCPTNQLNYSQKFYKLVSTLVKPLPI